MPEADVEQLVIRVYAGPRSREYCPVTLPVPWPADSLVQLHRERARRPPPCQLWSDGHRNYATWIVERLKAGATATYILTRGGRQRRPKSRVRVERLGPHRLHVLTQQRQLAVLRLERGWLCPFWTPVRAPTGHTVTATPAPGELLDAEGVARPTGLWTAAPVVAEQQEANVEMLGPVQWQNGPVFAMLRLDQQWQAAGSVRLTTTYRIYAASARWWLLELSVTLLANKGPTTLYHHPRRGLVNIQLAPPLWPAHRARLHSGLGAATTAEQLPYPTPWLDLSGLSGGRWVGLSVFLPPGAYAGERWFLSEEGVLAVGAVGPAGVPWRKLAAGESVRFCVRLCIHSGNAEMVAAAARYADYAFPPVVEVAQQQ